MDRINSPERAIRAVIWRKDAVPGQLIQQYQNARLSTLARPTAIDESALENVTGQGQTCGRDPVDIDGHGSSGFERATSICGHYQNLAAHRGSPIYR